MPTYLTNQAEEAVWESVRFCISAGAILDVTRTAKLILETFDHDGAARATIEKRLAEAAVAARVPILTGALSQGAAVANQT